MSQGSQRFLELPNPNDLVVEDEKEHHEDSSQEEEEIKLHEVPMKSKESAVIDEHLPKLKIRKTTKSNQSARYAS